jgi:hypothetical protein
MDAIQRTRELYQFESYGLALVFFVGVRFSRFLELIYFHFIFNIRTLYVWLISYKMNRIFVILCCILSVYYRPYASLRTNIQCHLNIDKTNIVPTLKWCYVSVGIVTEEVVMDLDNQILNCIWQQCSLKFPFTQIGQFTLKCVLTVHQLQVLAGNWLPSLETCVGTIFSMRI